ncbi:IGF-like family receptor 1 [Hippoglossus stenolepis]|uniref:IGF-like family receptor 1 n=1 Tax=Hippoglossus stenolepis TaxID=195615 RepID=UPI001FAF5957|nr:IGF-like family receptor 1 [Hippoglossus stenolepis]
MGYSEKCHDLTYYDRTTATCVPCEFKPGHAVNPNCGRDDAGGRHDVRHRKCEDNFFNDGSRARCVPCTSCPPGSNVIKTCNSTTDTECEKPRGLTTEVPVKNQTIQHTTFTPTGRALTTTFNPTPAASSSVVIWAVPLTILICITLLLISAYIIYMKRNQGRRPVLHFSKRSSLAKEGFAPLSAPACNNDVLSPDILAAPLQTVLNNLDVLEELVILLDPESRLVKNTKHLASQCSFPSTWITYTYSMKDSQSPLKAVLERVTSSNPDWTVGHLAKLLSQMERNDAIAVLAQLELPDSPV